MTVSSDAPSPRPWGVSDKEAVELCRDWMVQLGATDTRIKDNPSRETCDLYSEHFLGWVENARGNLDVELVEYAAALSAEDGRASLLFVPGGVFPDARERADALGVAVLRFRAQDGALDGVNGLGRRVREAGLIVG